MGQMADREALRNDVPRRGLDSLPPRNAPNDPRGGSGRERPQARPSGLGFSIARWWNETVLNVMASCGCVRRTLAGHGWANMLVPAALPACRALVAISGTMIRHHRCLRPLPLTRAPRDTESHNANGPGLARSARDPEAAAIRLEAGWWERDRSPAIAGFSCSRI